MQQPNLYTLGLHESYVCDICNCTILRVPGGWIYTHQDWKMAPLFVEYGDEFFNKDCLCPAE